MSLIDSLLMGTVIAAVSPAVIVPHMLKLMDEEYGTKQGIPQMILAGASADDVYVIVLFTCFSQIASAGSFNALMLLRIPTSILLGILGGSILGTMLSYLKKEDHSRMIILILCISFLLSCYHHHKMTQHQGLQRL